MNKTYESLAKVSENKRGCEASAHEIIPGLISVCMPNFNKAPYLRAAIESIAHQKYPKIELIIVDDQSTDESRNIIHNAIREFKSQITITSVLLPRRVGTAWAQNIAYFMAKGEFIVNMDSDDISHPDRLSLQQAAMTPDIDIIGTNFALFKESIDTPTIADGGYWLKYGPEIIQDSYLFDHRHCVCFGTLMFRRKVIDQIAGMNKRFIGTEDYEIVQRAVESGFRIENISTPLYFYRDNPTQRSKLFHSN